MQALDTKLQRDFGITFKDTTLLETAFTQYLMLMNIASKHFTMNAWNF